jgi:hypothetical protein
MWREGATGPPDRSHAWARCKPAGVRPRRKSRMSDPRRPAAVGRFLYFDERRPTRMWMPMLESGGAHGGCRIAIPICNR